MPAVVTWLVCFVFLVGESVLLTTFGIESFSLQLGIGITIFLGLRREFVSGALTLAALLPVIEWLVSGPMGFYSLGLVVVFLVLRGLVESIQRRWGMAQMVMAMFLALLHSGVMLFALLLTNPSSMILQSILWNMWLGSVIVGVSMIPLGRFLDRADRMLNPRSGRNVLEIM